MIGEPAPAVGDVAADPFGISVRTVELHRAHISEKLGARSISDLIRIGIILKAWQNTPA